MMTVLAFVFILLFIPSLTSAQDDPVTTQASNDCPLPAGQRPYELDWAGRERDTRPSLVDFQDLTGWTVEAFNGAEAELRRSRSQPLFDEFSARLVYKGNSPQGYMRIRPPSPVPVSLSVDSISVWVFGNNWEWVPDSATPRVDVFALLLDSDGHMHEVHLTNVRWKEWWLVHRRLTAVLPPGTKITAFAGFTIRNVSNPEEREIYFSSLSLYSEPLPPLEFVPRPRRGIDPFPGQSHGLNTGPGRLPFPTREETILPIQFAKDFKNSLEYQSRTREYLFSYTGRDSRIVYRWNPESGTPATIKAEIDGTIIRPLHDSGVTFEQDQPLQHLKSHRVGDTVRAVYQAGDQQVEWIVRIWQKSLVLDCISQGGRATGLKLGQFQGVEQPEIILTPFLTFGPGNNPGVLMARGKQGVYFGSVWIDWYRSNGSELYSVRDVSGTGAAINGGVRYIPKTDGRRNDLFERIFLTLSPVFEEAYPTVDNPPAHKVREAGNYLWQETWGPENYENQMQRSRMLASYGIRNLIQCNHETTWRDGGESFTLRTRAAPGKGGDEALQEYVRHQQSLGWRSGLYSNYTDFAPVNEHWDEDAVQREPSGQWRPAWPRNYALKPSRAIEFDLKLAGEIQQKYGTDAAYTDVMTAVSPWQYTDYDARVPGAGTFAATFYSYGEVLLNDQDFYGIAHSEGTYHWLYAGLATGNYGLCYTGIDPAVEPLNVAFNLYQIHPRETNIGMPWTAHFFRNLPGWDAPDSLDASIDHFLAATLAYGHMGWLVEEHYGVDRMCRSYYMLRPVTALYAGMIPEGIQYADEHGHLMSASRALSNGVIELSRLHVKYEGGLHLYINGSNLEWSVKTPHGTIRLPEWGWVAWSDLNGLMTYSALNGNQRFDYLVCQEYEYLDGRGTITQTGSLAAAGGVVRRGDKFLDIGRNSEIGFSHTSGGGIIEAFTPEGASLGAQPVKQGREGILWFEAVEGARTYHFTPDNTIKAVGASGPYKVVAGEQVTVTLTDGSRHSVSIPEDSISGRRMWLPVGDGDVDFNVVAPLVIEIGEIRSLADGSLQVGLEAVNNRMKPERVAVRVLEQSGITTDYASDSRIIERWKGSIVLKTDQMDGQWDLVFEAKSGDDVTQIMLPLESRPEHAYFHNLFAEMHQWNWATLDRQGTVRPGDHASGATWYMERVNVGGQQQEVLFSHPPYNGYTGSVFGDSPYFRAAGSLVFEGLAGLKDGGMDSDGVTFSVWLLTDDEEPLKLAERHVMRGNWQELTAEIPAKAGKRLRLRLMADVGPDNNSVSDWAVWGKAALRSVDVYPRLLIR